MNEPLILLHGQDEPASIFIFICLMVAMFIIGCLYGDTK